MLNQHFEKRIVIKNGRKVWRSFGIPHPSGLNRHERRTGLRRERRKPFHEKQGRIEDHHDLVKASKITAMTRRVESARGRAAERRAQQNKPAGTMTRARRSIMKRIARNVNDRRARHARHLAKNV